jgi:hypothetical protein
MVKAAVADEMFGDQLAAIKASIHLANETGKNGKQSVVVFQFAKNRFKRIWTYGIDPYPPSRSGLPEICAASTPTVSL